MSNIITPGAPTDYNQIRVPNVEIVGPRLLVMERPKRDYVTEGGIHVPDFAQQDAQIGAVVLVGDGVMLPDGTKIPPRVEQGDEIIYARYAGIELEMEGDEYLIINESDVRVVMSYRGKVFTLPEEEEAAV